MDEDWLGTQEERRAWKEVERLEIVVRAREAEILKQKQYARDNDAARADEHSERVAAQEECRRWREAHGAFGPQTPEEVPIFAEEAARVSREVAAHETALRGALALALGQQRLLRVLDQRVSRLWEAETTFWREIYERREER